MVWVALLTGFNMYLRKSNLVPLSRLHDRMHNISRRDVRYDAGVLVIFIRWTKTNQYGEKISEKIIVGDNNCDICPVRWIKYMTDRIPANPNHNLFSYHSKTGIVPITYRDLMQNLRKWLEKAGVTNSYSFSSHSMRRGATTHAFRSNIPDRTIMEMGGWRSTCYRRYIDIDTTEKLKAWKKFNKH